MKSVLARSFLGLFVLSFGLIFLAACGSGGGGTGGTSTWADDPVYIPPNPPPPHPKTTIETWIREPDAGTKGMMKAGDSKAKAVYGADRRAIRRPRRCTARM